MLHQKGLEGVFQISIDSTVSLKRKGNTLIWVGVTWMGESWRAKETKTWKAKYGAEQPFAASLRSTAVCSYQLFGIRVIAKDISHSNFIQRPVMALKRIKVDDGAE